jgi:hypothetical protein
LNPPGSRSALGREPFLQQSDPGNYFMSADLRLIATAKGVYQADFKARALKPVFSLTNDEEICGFCGYQGGPMPYGNEGGPPKSILLTTKSAVRLLDSQGGTILDLPYQPGYVEYPQVGVFFLRATNGSTANFAVWFYPDIPMNQKSGWKMPQHVLWLGPGQTVARSADLPASHTQMVDPWPQKLVATLLPPAAHLASDHNIYSPWNALCFALALISAGVAWVLARRHNASIMAGIGWTLFVFLLGVAGLLTLLSAQEWAAREPCPNFNKLRAVDRELCEHCQAPFAPPEKNGTEIFAPL